MLQCKYSSSLLLLTQIGISICWVVVGFEFIAKRKRIEAICAGVKAACATIAHCFWVWASTPSINIYLVLFLFQFISVIFYRVHAIVIAFMERTVKKWEQNSMTNKYDESIDVLRIQKQQLIGNFSKFTAWQTSNAEIIPFNYGQCSKKTGFVLATNLYRPIHTKNTFWW